MSPSVFQRRQKARAWLPAEPASSQTLVNREVPVKQDQEVPPVKRVAGSCRARSINDTQDQDTIATSPEIATPGAAPSASQAAPREDLCQFPFSDGRHCRMPRWQKHDTYCLYHAHDEQQLLGAEQVAEQLVSLSGEFKTASDVNHVLGKLFSLRAKNRISRRDAVALTYMAQLMLQSLPGVRSEIIRYGSSQGWESTLDRVFANANDSDKEDENDE